MPLFTRKTWHDDPAHDTPINATGLNDFEGRTEAAINGVGGTPVATNGQYITAVLATNVREVGRIPMAKAYRVKRIVTSQAARVRLYSTSAKRDADLARPATVDPPDYPVAGGTPDHGCMFETITDAAHLDLPVAPNIAGSELSDNDNVPITVDNLGANGAVTVTIYYQRLEV